MVESRAAFPLGRLLAAVAGGRKRALIVAFDMGAMLVSLWLAFSIRLGVLYWPAKPLVFILAGLAVVSGVAALTIVGTYRMVLRFLDVKASMRLLFGAAAVAACWFVLAYVSGDDSLPRSVGFIYFGLVYLLLFFGRYMASELLNGARARLRFAAIPERKIGTAIYGVNFAGVSLAKSLENHPLYQLRLFIDDQPDLGNRMVNGCPIVTIAELKERWDGGIEKILLAMPFAPKTLQIEVLARFSELPVQVMSIPSYGEIVTGGLSVADLKPINVEDLLEREVVPPHGESLDRDIHGKRILVTGAGGSIGSELCRQIVGHGPAALVLLDHSEFALYAIEAELQRRIGEDKGSIAAPKERIALHAVIGSILNEPLVRSILADHAIDTVFHAAAYKHVPLLERNEIVGVENNVTGTRIVADACLGAGVQRMTMVSTDKAVRPTSVMGASKRAAELYVQALAERGDPATRFGIVRFGNVLDSSGSVVQRFRQQIANGGPITVTDEEITRFFMSIPEATQLVLQASSMSTGGEVFVLDMGEPVRIVDLARAMIALSGRTERHPGNPNGDIEIIYVGLRPGEKLHEELFIGDDVVETAHPHVRMARERTLPMEMLELKLKRLDRALRGGDAHLVRHCLSELVEPCVTAVHPVGMADALHRADRAGAVAADSHLPL